MSELSHSESVADPARASLPADRVSANWPAGSPADSGSTRAELMRDASERNATRITLSSTPAWPATRPSGWSAVPKTEWAQPAKVARRVPAIAPRNIVAAPHAPGRNDGDAPVENDDPIEHEPLIALDALDESTLSMANLARVQAAERRTREILQKYRAAMREMQVRCEIIDQDLSLKKHRNPIHHVESRIKSPESIFEKLGRYGKEPTLENMERYIMDIAGIRIICSYIQDVYNMLDLLRRQDDLVIVTVKDYIANPKPNGYRSLHVIIRIPVYFLDKKELIPVEIQLRTIAMDFWASLEHDLKYKAVREIEGIDAARELKDCSRIIEEVEARMQILSRALDVDD